jgi:hypothetical protein
VTEPFHHIDREPDKTTGINAEYFSGQRYDYQTSIDAIADVDLMAGTPGQDINWLEDIEMLEEDGQPAVFDRYSNAFIRIYFDLPKDKDARDDIARRVLLCHLQSGNAYGLQLKSLHCKFPQPMLGSWVADSAMCGTDWKSAQLEGWTPPAH